jgi:type IV pilus assembly protein PilW
MIITDRQIQTQKGFGIIEVMIALFLGIIIMLGVTEVATNNSKTRYEVERAGRQIESAAYALRLLEGDLTNAAFWGERRAVTAGLTPPPICLDDGTNVTAAVMDEALGYPLQGGHIYEAPSNVAPYDSINCPPADDPLEPKAGTDYLAIRRASSCALGSDGCDPAGGNFHLQVNACFDQDSPQDTERVEISVNAGSLLSTNRDCVTTAPVYRFLNRIYYVNLADQLVRAELVGTDYVVTPLVDDVEMLRFEYGLDTSGDGQEEILDPAIPAEFNDPYPSEPDEETNGAVAADISRWADVVRVTIFLVVRSQTASTGFRDEKIYDIAKLKYDYSTTPAGKSVDWDSPVTYCANLPPRPACDVTIAADVVGHRRQLYTRTVSLRNVAGRRE